MNDSCAQEGQEVRCDSGSASEGAEYRVWWSPGQNRPMGAWVLYLGWLRLGWLKIA